jgi:hypothetical protein
MVEGLMVLGEKARVVGSDSETRRCARLAGADIGADIASTLKRTVGTFSAAAVLKYCQVEK